MPPSNSIVLLTGAAASRRTARDSPSQTDAPAAIPDHARWVYPLPVPRVNKPQKRHRGGTHGVR